MTSKQSAGGFARAAALPPDRRRLIASAAARARWAGKSASTDEVFAYVIGAADGPMKVGLTRQPVERRAALQVGNHSELAIHHAVPVPKADARAVEAYAHWLISHSSIGGEWFGVSIGDAIEAVDSAIAAVAAGERAPRRPSKQKAKREVARMIFDLTDDDRAALERARIAMGLRSHAETLRALIRGAGGAPANAEPRPGAPSPTPHRGRAVVAPKPRGGAEVVVSRRPRGFDTSGEPIY